MSRILLIVILLASSFVSHAQHPSCEWIRILGGPNSIIESSASCIDNKGNIYLSGFFVGNIALSPTHTIKTADSAAIFIVKYTPSGTVAWSKKIDRSICYNYIACRKIKTDSKGNVYCSLVFNENIWLEINNELKEYRSVGQEDALLLKLNSKGSILWAKHFGSALDDNCVIDIDNSGNVYAAGSFLNNIDFNKPAAIEFDENQKRPILNLFVLKLNPQGSILWVKHMPSESITFCSDIKITPTRDILLTGAIHRKTDFNPGIDSFFIQPTYPNTVEGYLLKLTTDGEFVWVKQLHSKHSYGLAVMTDDNGFIYTSGILRGSLTAGALKISADTTVEYDSYFMKSDTDGKNIFLKNTFTNYKAQGTSIAIDSENNSYFAGLYSDTLDSNLQSMPPPPTFEKPFANGFLYKLNVSGEPIWLYTFGNQYSLVTQPTILVSRKNELFLTGSFLGNFMPGNSQSPTDFDTATKQIYIMKIKQ
ncbi:MAG: hypothetical protein ACTHJT_14885 [Cytophaga sp.]|uniref:hypothetical protein n=1 Tax=Cytophaga sp. TaxID=29535 RepID=UPI003F7EC398